MQIVEAPGVKVWFSENIPYLRVDLEGMLQIDAYRAALEAPALWDLVAAQQVRNVCLNHAPLWKYSTDYYAYKSQTWLPRAAAAGIAKVSIVVQESVWAMMQGMLGGLAPATPEVRSFPQSMFYDTTEAVSWF